MTQLITLLPGVAGIKAGYEAMLGETALDIVCLAKHYSLVMGDYFDREYAPKLYQLATREILPDTKENRQYAQAKSGKNQVHFLSGQSESDLVVGEKQVLLASFNPKSPSAILVTDPELVAHFRLVFARLWQSTI